MAQYTYETVGGDTLPSVAEACGHAGEWTAIIETAPWLEGLDYLAVPPGTPILLPAGWYPPGAAPTDFEYPAAAESGSSSHARARTREASSKDD